MKTILGLLIILGLVLQLFPARTYAGSNYRTIQNVSNANEYIAQLQEGANPNSITRPHLLRHNTWKGKRTRKRLIKAMDRAETLARSGRNDLIRQYDYQAKSRPE